MVETRRRRLLESVRRDASIARSSEDVTPRLRHPVTRYVHTHRHRLEKIDRGLQLTRHNLRKRVSVPRRRVVEGNFHKRVHLGASLFDFVHEIRLQPLMHHGQHERPHGATYHQRHVPASITGGRRSMRRGLVLAAHETAAAAGSMAAPRELARAHPLLARRHRRHDAAERGDDDERTDHARVTPPPVARARVTAEHRFEFGLSLDSHG